MGKFVIKAVKSGLRFDLKAGNGETIATSEAYESRRGCLKGIESVRHCAPAAPVEDQTGTGFVREKHPKFEIYRDSAGEYRFRLKAANGQVIAVSEGYASKAGCLNGVKSIRRNAPGAAIADALEVY